MSYFIDVISNISATERQSLWDRIGGILVKKLRLPLVIGVTIGVVQQITGINAIFFYVATNFEQSGISTDVAFTQVAHVGVINVIFILVAIALIHR